MTNVTPVETTDQTAPEPIWRDAAELVAGDRIAAGFLQPDREAAEVLFTYAFPLSANRDPFVLVVYRADDRDPDVEYYLADSRIPLEAFTNATGMDYTRADTDADDPTPVSPARQTPHVGGIEGRESESGVLVDNGRLVAETAGPTCQFEFGGGSIARQRCGDPIRWDERYAKWVHADGVWPGHDAVPAADATVSGTPEGGERVEVGADGCGCPITEEIRPNSSSIDGTERVEHRPRCWAAELKPWESNAPLADRIAESMEPIAEATCKPECGGGRQCRCQGGWS